MAGSCSRALGFVLHLLYLVGLGDRAARYGERQALCVERIAGPFRALGCPLRNAGALCAWLCREAPRAADPPELAELHEILTGGSWVPQMVLSHPLLGAIDQAEEPGLGPAEFEELVYRAANSLSDQEIRHWLRHGRGGERERDRAAAAPPGAERGRDAGRTGAQAPARGNRPAGQPVGGSRFAAPSAAGLVRFARGWLFRHHDQG